MLQLLRKHKLYAELSKYFFAQPEVHFLGHVVGAQGLRLDPKKVEIVKNWPVPKTASELRSFTGFANHHRNFTQGYANLSAPLDVTAKDTQDFQWTPERQAAFQMLPVLTVSSMHSSMHHFCVCQMNIPGLK